MSTSIASPAQSINPQPTEGSKLTFESLKDNWKLWAGIGGGVGLLLILIFVSICLRKRRAAAKIKGDQDLEKYNNAQVTQFIGQGLGQDVPAAGQSFYNPGGFVQPQQPQQQPSMRAGGYTVSEVDSDYQPSPMPPRTPAQTQAYPRSPFQQRSTLQAPQNAYTQSYASPSQPGQYNRYSQAQSTIVGGYR